MHAYYNYCNFQLHAFLMQFVESVQTKECRLLRLLLAFHPPQFLDRRMASSSTSSSSSLRSYISDNSIKFFGISESSIIDFVIASASKSKSTSDLFSSLQSLGLNDSQEARKFSEELFNRVPRKDSKPLNSDSIQATSSKKEKEKRYALLKDDALIEDADELNIKPEKKRKKKKHKLDEEIDDRDRDTDQKGKGKERQVEDGEENQEDEALRLERERLKDLEERDSFANRLKSKDQSSTKKLVEDRTNPELAAMRLLGDDELARQKAMPDLRERSRAEYLNKRSEQQLDLLKLEIQDEERFFRGMKMSKREKKDLEYKKEVLRLAEERKEIERGETQGYSIPEDYLTEKGKLDGKKKEKALYQRCEFSKSAAEGGSSFLYPLTFLLLIPSHSSDDDAKAERLAQQQHITDVDLFEKEQTEKAQFLPAPKAGDPAAELIEEYDYVFDESQTIAFVMDQNNKLESTLSPEDLKLQVQIKEAEQKADSIEATRKSLPVYSFREKLLAAVAEYQVLIVVGETGSGKTTQLPQFLHEAGYTKGGMKVGCTQPRRVAAMSVAARVAEEMGVRLGRECGYSIRFEDCTSEVTVVKYMTDGMLLREFLTEPDLSAYSALIIDEAHERTLSTDVLFGLLKDIARFRPDLKLIIASATLDAEKFSGYFDGAPIFYVPGRRFPVDIHYTPQPEANYLHAAITTVFQIHTTQPRGDILVFLTGQDEIDAAQESLAETAHALGNKVGELIICPIYANLPSEMQSKIFEETPPGARKVSRVFLRDSFVKGCRTDFDPSNPPFLQVVLATNIAETSITIDGVVFVIDPGFVKQNSYNPRTGMSALTVVPVSSFSSFPPFASLLTPFTFPLLLSNSAPELQQIKELEEQVELVLENVSDSSPNGLSRMSFQQTQFQKSRGPISRTWFCC